MFNGQIEPEHTRHKKILDYFIKYMNENLTGGAENLMLLSREASNDTTDVRLTRQQNCEVVSSGQSYLLLKGVLRTENKQWQWNCQMKRCR